MVAWGVSLRRVHAFSEFLKLIRYLAQAISIFLFPLESPLPFRSENSIIKGRSCLIHHVLRTLSKFGTVFPHLQSYDGTSPLLVHCIFHPSLHFLCQRFMPEQSCRVNSENILPGNLSFLYQVYCFHRHCYVDTNEVYHTFN